MENTTNQQNQKDPQLWELAKKRASFKTHLSTYFVMNAFFWAVWYLTGRNNYGNGSWPWPVWSMLGWGIGLAFHYVRAYVAPKENLAEKEYEKLKNKNS